MKNWLLQHKWWLLIVIFLGFLTEGYTYHHQFVSSVTEQQQENILNAAQHLPMSGLLQQNGDGYLYLKVDDNYIHQLFPFVQEPGFNQPSAINRSSQVGAHISVMYKNEAQESGQIKEIGNRYAFALKDFKYVKAKGKTFAILEVEAPDLEKLRLQYGLSSKLLNHEFHITIAEKSKNHSHD